LELTTRLSDPRSSSWGEQRKKIQFGKKKGKKEEREKRGGGRGKKGKKRQGKKSKE
jgi:hypothetical protein